VKGSLVATSLTNFHYVARKLVGADQATSAVRDLMTLFDIISVDHWVLLSALGRPWPDFEDAVQDAAAELAGISIVVTRDLGCYSKSTRRIVAMRWGCCFQPSTWLDRMIAFSSLAWRATFLSRTRPMFSSHAGRHENHAASRTAEGW
jgi:hypothetical protein